MPVYAFDDFEIDLERFELRRQGEPVPIGPRAFDVLAYLIHHRERAVSKQELISKVWGVVALSSAAVPTCIGEVRKALGDGAGAGGLIVTVPKRGYRFEATVRLRGEAGVSSGAFETSLDGGLPCIGATERPSTTLLPALAQALAVTTDALRGVAALDKAARPDARLLRRMQQIERMNAREKRQVLHLLDAFIEREQLRASKG